MMWQQELPEGFVARDVARAKTRNERLLKDALAAQDIDPDSGSFTHTTLHFRAKAKARHGRTATVKTVWADPKTPPVRGGGAVGGVG